MHGNMAHNANMCVRTDSPLHYAGKETVKRQCASTASSSSLECSAIDAHYNLPLLHLLLLRFALFDSLDFLVAIAGQYLSFAATPNCSLMRRMFC
jgi:hypothetical protein